MNQSPKVYDMASAAESLEPWLRQHLPNLDPVARRHFVHLVTGIIEQQSLVLGAIAAASPFQAEPESNYTQVQRIIRDTRLTLETVYYPFLHHILAAMPGEHAYLTLDQTNHGPQFNVVLLGWASDGISLPLGFVVYATDEGWANQARELLGRLESVIPQGRTITLLADRIHAGDPFLSCLDELDWGYVIRLPEDTFIADADGEWVEVRHLRQRAGRMRVFRNVRIWKGSVRRATVCLYRRRAADGATVSWYLVTNLAGEHTRFVEYACRWWQECTHKLLKSALFHWEDGRVRAPERVAILLMAFGCACWALWCLGRAHERVRHPTTPPKQRPSRRQNIIKRGWDVLQSARKQRCMPVMPSLPQPRVLDYHRRFPGLRLPCDANLVALW
jgi:hypothetical protein